MSEAWSYLAGHRLYWINLRTSMSDTAEQRCHWMESGVTPLFREAVRVEAINGATDVSDYDCGLFVAGWKMHWDADKGAGGDNLLTAASKPPGRNFHTATHKANVAIRRSHRLALLAGIADSRTDERFFVAEDDIVPRAELFTGTIPAPPQDADVVIWSGGIPMAAVRTDDRLYASGKAFSWLQVTPRQAFNCLGAGLYEVTPRAAEAIVAAVEKIPMSFDHAWAYALKNLEVIRMVPNAFAQAGPSIRNNAVREPIVER